MGPKHGYLYNCLQKNYYKLIYINQNQSNLSFRQGPKPSTVPQSVFVLQLHGRSFHFDGNGNGSGNDISSIVPKGRFYFQQN